MAFSILRVVRNGMFYPRISKNIHFSSGNKVDSLKDKPDPFKKSPTETEKRVMMALKFAAVFLPGVYIGSYLQQKGFFNWKKANKHVLEKASEITEKADSKIKEIKEEKK